jgi:hypothetical protein
LLCPQTNRKPEENLDQVLVQTELHSDRDGKGSLADPWAVSLSVTVEQQEQKGEEGTAASLVFELKPEGAQVIMRGVAQNEQGFQDPGLSYLLRNPDEPDGGLKPREAFELFYLTLELHRDLTQEQKAQEAPVKPVRAQGATSTT